MHTGPTRIPLPNLPSNPLKDPAALPAGSGAQKKLARDRQRMTAYLAKFGVIYQPGYNTSPR